jgi:hypothetical protein
MYCYHLNGSLAERVAMVGNPGVLHSDSFAKYAMAFLARIIQNRGNLWTSEGI